MHPDLRRLRDDPSIQELYSAKLDSLLSTESSASQTVNEVEELVTNAIQQATMETILQELMMKSENHEQMRTIKNF